MPLFIEHTKGWPRPITTKDFEAIETDCASWSWDDMRDDPDLKCVAAAADDAAMRACWIASLARPRDKADGLRVIELVARAAVAMVRRDGALPRGDIFLTPAIPCCARIGHRCRSGYDGAILAGLLDQAGFSSFFQLTYRSDGTKLDVTAVGDLDCDGNAITFTLTGEVRRGELQYKIVEPTNPD